MSSAQSWALWTRSRSLASIILTQEGTEHLFGSHRVFPLCYNTVFYSKTSTALCDVVFNCNVKTKKGFWLRIPQRIPYQRSDSPVWFSNDTFQGGGRSSNYRIISHHKLRTYTKTWRFSKLSLSVSATVNFYRQISHRNQTRYTIIDQIYFKRQRYHRDVFLLCAYLTWNLLLDFNHKQGNILKTAWLLIISFPPRHIGNWIS